jgi:alpha-glucosidase
VAAEDADPDSMLRLYRTALRIRSERAGAEATFEWLASPADVLAFARGADLINVTNLSATAVPLPPHRGVLVASADVADGHLPPDASVWLQPDPDAPASPAWRWSDDKR